MADVEFLKKLKWDEYIDDEEIKDILTKIKERAAQVDGGDADDNCPRIKLVIVGDGAVGKTSLLETYKTGVFPEAYVPTVFDNTTLEINHQGQKVLVQLWDTAGQEDYDRLRPLSYPGSDIVLICYSCASEASYEAVVEKWHPEVSHYAEGVPQLLVGTKYDLREAGVKDSGDSPVTKEQGKELADDIGAAGFLETSAKTAYNLKQLFEEALTIALKSKSQPKEDKKKERSSKKKKSSSSSKSSKSK